MLEMVYTGFISYVFILKLGNLLLIIFHYRSGGNVGGLRLFRWIPGQCLCLHVSTEPLEAGKPSYVSESSNRLSKNDRGYVFIKNLCCES